MGFPMSGGNRVQVHKPFSLRIELAHRQNRGPESTKARSFAQLRSTLGQSAALSRTAQIFSEWRSTLLEIFVKSVVR